MRTEEEPRTAGRMRRASVAACIATALALGGPAPADLLVDTGPGGTSSVGSWAMFNDGASFDFLAGKFTLAGPANLTSVEGWMAPFSIGGDVDVKIRAGGAIPGSPIFSKTYTLGDRFVAGWDAFTDYDVALPAGTYWLSFEPVAGSGMNYSMPPGAPSPLASYAYLVDGNPGWIEFSPNPGLGFRVSGTPVAAAPLGTAVRSILVMSSEFPDGLDTISGGYGAHQTIRWNINLSGHGWAVGQGIIYANWLEAGAEAVSSQAYNAARAVAFRSFQNTSPGPLTLRVNAELHGEFDDGFGLTDLAATGGIHALASDPFSDTIAASGQGAAEFLLGGDALSPTVGAADRVDLSLLFPPAARLGSDTAEVPYQSGPVSVPLQTGLFTVDPEEVFTLLFDVSALSAGSGSGGTQFFDTLEPAPVLFTDAGGAPVAGIEALGQGLAVGETSLLSWDEGARNALSWRTAVGASGYRLYRGGGSDLEGLFDATPDSCLRYEGGAASTGPILTEDPLPGELYWYLAAGVDGPNEGSAGAGRVANASGSCP